MRRIVLEAAEDDAAEGSGWLELQVDPTSYAPFVGGLTPALEIVLDAAREATAATGCSVAVVVAASRIRHPLDARTLARLAARYAGEGPGQVVGFGLSNDERRGTTDEFVGGLLHRRRAGLASVPHSGELLGPAHVRATLDALHPDRLGHGVRSAEDPELLARIVDAGIGLEVCPTSNVALGVYPTLADVPLRAPGRRGSPARPGRRRPAALRPAARRAVPGGARGPRLHRRRARRSRPLVDRGRSAPADVRKQLRRRRRDLARRGRRPVSSLTGRRSPRGPPQLAESGPGRSSSAGGVTPGTFSVGVCRGMSAGVGCSGTAAAARRRGVRVAVPVVLRRGSRRRPGRPGGALGGPWPCAAPGARRPAWAARRPPPSVTPCRRAGRGRRRGRRRGRPRPRAHVRRDRRQRHEAHSSPSPGTPTGVGAGAARPGARRRRPSR